MATIAETLKGFKDDARAWQARPRVAKAIAIGRTAYQDINRINLFQRAGGMAYTTLFSIVPSLAATFAIISAFQPVTDTDAQWFDRFRGFVLSYLAPDTGYQVVEYLENFLLNLDATKIGLTGLAGLLVTLILLLHNIEETLNEIWQVRSNRSLFRRFIFFWTFCTLGAFMLTLVLGVLSSFELGNLLPGAQTGLEKGLGADIASKVSTIAATFLFFAFIFKIAPNCRVDFKPAVIGAAVATVLIRIASSLFAYYAAHTTFYANVYGAVAAVPFFLLWLYVGWVVTLIGALISWRVQVGHAAHQQVTAPVARTPQDVERELQIRGAMPLLCLLAVGKTFLADRRRGVTAEEIAGDLKLPIGWVVEGLRAAAALGFVVMAGTRADADAGGVVDGDGNEATAQYFLTTTPESLSIAEIVGRLTQGASQWLQIWRERSEMLPADALSKLWSRDWTRDAGRDLTLADLLAQPVPAG